MPVYKRSNVLWLWQIMIIIIIIIIRGPVFAKVVVEMVSLFVW